MQGELTLIEGVYERRDVHPLTEGVAVAGEYVDQPEVGKRFFIALDLSGDLWTGTVKSRCLGVEDGATHFRTNRSTYKLVARAEEPADVALAAAREALSDAG